MVAAKRTNSDDSATKRGKTSQCLSPAAVSYDNRAAKTGKIDTLNNLTMDQPRHTLQTVESSILIENPFRSEYEREDMSKVRDDQMKSIPSEMLEDSDEPDILPKLIGGTPSLKIKIENLLQKYKFLFCRKVRSTPANITPFNFTVQDDLWQVPNNRLQPRRLINKECCSESNY